jgi:PST family polysaccharide transporter
VSDALAAKARSGTHAMLVTRMLAMAVSFISITVYARLVGPADYGIWAIASLAFGVVTLLRELGLTAAIVQSAELRPDEKDAYFWTSVAVSLAGAGLLALAAPVLAQLYGAPALRPVLWVCCLALALNGAALVPAALLRRRLEYRRLALMEGGALVCGLAVGVTGALLWRDVWALVAGHVATAAWTAASAWVLCGWAPRAPTRTPARLNHAFNLQLAAYNCLNFLSNNACVALGHRLGSTADLGYLNRAQQLYAVGYLSFLSPISEVGYSLLCRLRDGAGYRHAYIALARRVGVLAIPYAVVLGLLAEDLVVALLGPAWRPAAPVLAVLAPAVLGGTYIGLFALLLMSQGRGRELRRFAVADLALRATGALLGSRFGIVGMAAGFSAAELLLSTPLMAWICARHGPVQLRDQLEAMWPGVLLAAVVTAATASGLGVARALGLAAGWPRLFLVGTAAVLAWGALGFLVVPARDAILGRGLARA